MKFSTDKLVIDMLILGLLVGGGAGWLLATPSDTKTETQATSTLPKGFREVTVNEAGMRFAVRETDQVTGLAHEKKRIGIKIFDPYAQATGAQVDIILDRVEEFYDLPAATTIAEYEVAVEGLSIQKNLPVNLNGLTGVKQLYTAQLGQKRGDGAIIKRPVSNLMRYVLLAPDGRIVLIKTSAAFQTYLDRFVQNLHFIPVTQGGDSDGIDLGADAAIDVNPEATGEDLLNITDPGQGVDLR